MSMPSVEDYMTRELVTLSPDGEINHAMSILLSKRISGAPVVDREGWLIGVLSKKDCLAAALEASYYREWGGTVSKYMSVDVQTVEADMDIISVTKLFVDGPYRRLPVLKAGRLIGQISRADALKAMANLWN